MFFRFRLESPDAMMQFGKKLTRFVRSILIVTSVFSIAAGAQAAQSDEAGAQAAQSDESVGRPILREGQFQSFDSKEEQPEKTEKTNPKPNQHTENNNGSENRGDYAVLGVGDSNMMPTEFVIDSDEYGTGQYRRYIGYYESPNKVRKPSGQLIQEILITRDDADAGIPLKGLNLPEDGEPVGLQVTGFVAVKIWLTEVLTKHNGCLIKPGEKNDGGSSWLRTASDDDTSMGDCALSFRLTVDTKAPGKLSEHKTKVFLKGELCRYPEHSTEFNSGTDDAECVEVTTPEAVSKKQRLFLSESDERIRAIKSIKLAEKIMDHGMISRIKEVSGLDDSLTQYANVGEVSDMFAMFLSGLSAMGATAYGWQFGAEYLGGIKGKTYQEHLSINDHRFNGHALKDFLKPHVEAGGFDENTKDNLKSAGLESTVSEMFTEDDETGEMALAYKFRLESQRGMAFEHPNGEVIRLLDNSKMSALGKKSVEVREVKAKVARCQATRIDELAKCKKLEIEKENLDKEIKAMRDTYEQAMRGVEATVGDMRDRIDELQGKLDTERSTDELQALEEERQRHDQAVQSLTKQHQDQLDTLNKQLVSAKDELRELQTQNINAKNAKRSLIQNIHSLNSKLRDADSNFQERVRQENDSLEAKLNRAKDRVKALTKERDELALEIINADRTKDEEIKALKSKYKADLLQFRGTLIENISKMQLYIIQSYAQRGFNSDMKKPESLAFPSMEVTEDKNGYPRANLTPFEERE